MQECLPLNPLPICDSYPCSVAHCAAHSPLNHGAAGLNAAPPTSALP